MSALIAAVLKSSLPPDLKFTAVVFASFGNDEGFRIWPAVDQVAHLRGLSGRQVQRHLKELIGMQILEVIKPATQWYPAHYRLRVDQLPARAPWRPPDLQASLLEAGGESPGAGARGSPPVGLGGDMGFTPARGDILGVRGDIAVSPDLPHDLPRTHTYYARARAGHDRAGVKPASPLDESSEAKVDRDPRLPMVGPVVRDPDHAAHSHCGRVCVPRFLHKQFRKALGGPVSRRASRLRAFYRETLEAIPAARPIGDEPVRFWRAAFAARYGGAAPRLVQPVRSAALDHSNAEAWAKYRQQREKERTGS
jgi:hypothetical protein